MFCRFKRPFLSPRKPPRSSIDTSGPSPSAMKVNDMKVYSLDVGSADMTAWAKTILANDSQELYVEIKLDQKMVNATKAVERSDIVFWDETVILIGNSSSTVSLSIMQRTSGAVIQNSCIAFVDIVLATLLARCVDDELVPLEMKLVSIEPSQPVTGVITAKLTDLGSLALHVETIGIQHLDKFQQLGAFPELEHAISKLTAAVMLTDQSHPDKPMYLSNLGVAQKARFDRLGYLPDLENVIANTAKAIALTDDRHLDKPKYLSTLSYAQQMRFTRLGALSDLDDAISNQAKAVELTDEGHQAQPMYLSNLGTAQQIRFERTGNLSDLEDAISNNAKAVDLADAGHPDRPRYLSNLGNTQEARFDRLGNLSDLENAISNKAKAVELTDENNLDKPGLLSNLGLAQETRFDRLGNLSDLENAISNKAKAVELTDDAHPDRLVYLCSLGSAQQNRFLRLGVLSDLDNAIFNKAMAVQLTDDGHPSKPGRLTNLGNAQEVRFKRFGVLSDLEDAISNKANAVELMDEGHPSKPAYLTNLGNAQEGRFDRLGDLSDLENAISNKTKAVELTDDRHPNKPAYLSNLGCAQRTRFKHLGDWSDLENAISNQAKAVELTDDGHPNQTMYLSNLGNTQQTRFDYLGALSNLEDTMPNKAKAVERTDGEHPAQAGHLSNLLMLSRLKVFMASISSFKAAAQLKAAHPHHALYSARRWAEASHIIGNLPSALDGYRTALELLPKVVWLGLDTPSRQDRLLSEKLEDLGSLAATCAIQLGNLEAAVELLDLGRSIFWQQASSLRTDLELLRAEDSKLAAELQRVGRQLDAGNFSHSPMTPGDNHVNHGQCSEEEVGKERRRLVRLWEDLVDLVRQLPKFKYFLRPVPFDELRQASAGGHIIVINVSKYRVDALILSPSQPIEHVPLPHIDLKVLSKLSDDILHRRPAFATEKAQRDYTSRYLKPALRIVWNDILVPIFYRLSLQVKHSVGTPQHRIWWYPTGPLTFIPLHAAAGPWMGSTEMTDVSQLFISSYVTSLSSLLQAQKRSKQVAMSGLQLLAVSQPNTSDLCPLPQSIVEVKKLVDAAHSAAAYSDGNPKLDILHLSGSDATISRVLGALGSFSWVHFACHGSQHPTVGMNSAFALHDGHLKLGEIASKSLPSAQFAFLSACHAAAGLKDLPGEAMHLAAGLQFAGFPSVIATMWSICDDDAPTVAEHAYKYLFRNGLEALDPSEAATALNRAIQRLREDPKVTVDRWAPFIHFGI